MNKNIMTIIPFAIAFSLSTYLPISATRITTIETKSAQFQIHIESEKNVRKFKNILLAQLYISSKFIIIEVLVTVLTVEAD